MVDIGRRKHKQAVRRALLNEPAETAAEAAAEKGLIKGINALFPCLYDLDERVKWGAVSAIGILADRLAGKDVEAARVIVRRLMWSLNDESGGIGWGSAEAIGEILSRNLTLAGEYRHILFSYAREDGNYLELPQLQRGLLWGIGRFAGARPAMVDASSIEIHRYLSSPDAAVRGLAAWVAGIIQFEDVAEELRRLSDDRGTFVLYTGVHIEEKSVGDTARDALRRVMEAENQQFQ